MASSFILQAFASSLGYMASCCMFKSGHLHQYISSKTNQAPDGAVSDERLPGVFFDDVQNAPHCYNCLVKNSEGKIIIPSGVNVWRHELKTAQALSAIGCTVEFIRKSERERERSADVFIDSVKFEMKSPTSSKLSAVQDNLKKASKQSASIVFDSRRMKKVPDSAIERELAVQLHKSKTIMRILFVNRHGIVIDIV